MQQLAIGFDYGQLDDDARTIVESCRDEIRRREKRATEDIIEIGRNLGLVRDAMPGRFEEWIAAEFEWSRRTAYQFIRVSDVFGGRVQSLHIGPSALYALASGTVPESIRDEFIERAEAGESIRYRDVRERLDAARHDLWPDGFYDDPAHADEHEAMNAAAESPPLLSVVDLETGEVIATAEEYLAQERATPSLRDVPVSAIPAIREPSREERAFDRLIAMSIITDLDPAAVADAAADFRGDTARLLMRRLPALESWSAAFVARLRERFETPLRAVR